MAHVRRVPLLVSLGALTLALLVALGGQLMAPSPPDPRLLRSTLESQGAKQLDVGSLVAQRAAREEPPGHAVPALAYLDGLLVLTLALMVASSLLPRLTARVHGPIRLLVSLLILLGSCLAVVKTVSLLLMMVGLFLAAPFGTIAYLALWGFFDTRLVLTTLSLSIVLKLMCVVCLLLASLTFVNSKTLLAIVFCSLLSNALTSFLLGLVPGILASMADAAAGIVIGLFAIVWSAIMCLGAIMPTLSALRPEPSLA